MKNRPFLAETIQELPLKEVGDYIEFNNGILSTKIIINRTHEVIVRFSPEYIIEQINDLLKLSIWLDYEKRTLEMLKKLLESFKKKEKFQLTRIKVKDFIKFARYAFEASIERASWVKDKVITATIKKAYDKYTATILFVLNQNILLLKKIKEIEPEDEHEMVQEIKKLMRIGPKIQDNILNTYILISGKTKQDEIVKEILNETLEYGDEYYSIDEI